MMETDIEIWKRLYSGDVEVAKMILLNYSH